MTNYSASRIVGDSRGGPSSRAPARQPRRDGGCAPLTAGRDPPRRSARPARKFRTIPTIWRRGAWSESCSAAAAMPTRFFVVLSMLMCVCAPAQAQPQPRAMPAAQDPLVRMNESVDALTRKVWPSVVHIMVSSYATREDERAETAVVDRQQSSGSGFVIDPDGYILTNAHVVNGARRVQVVLPAANADGSLATALSNKMQDRRRAHCRHHHRAGSRAVEGRRLEVAGAAARDLLGPAPGRDGVRVRQPERTAQQPDARDGLGRGAASDA